MAPNPDCRSAARALLLEQQPDMTSHNRNLFAGLCALSVLVPLCAAAETYLDISLSMVMPATHEVRGTISGDLDLTTDSGFGLAVAWGKQHEGGGMTELEFGYHATDTDEFATPDGYPLVWPQSDPNAYQTSTGARGDISTTSLMVNHYGAFGEGAARPYLGAGLGVALHAIDLETTPGVLHRVRNLRVPDTLDDEVVAFAWQVMAGIRYREFRLGYRYFTTGDTEADGFEITHGKHMVEVGMRF